MSPTGLFRRQCFATCVAVCRLPKLTPHGAKRGTSLQPRVSRLVSPSVALSLFAGRRRCCLCPGAPQPFLLGLEVPPPPTTHRPDDHGTGAGDDDGRLNLWRFSQGGRRRRGYGASRDLCQAGRDQLAGGTRLLSGVARSRRARGGSAGDLGTSAAAAAGAVTVAVEIRCAGTPALHSCIHGRGTRGDGPEPPGRDHGGD